MSLKKKKKEKMNADDRICLAHLERNSANGIRWEKPFCRIRIVSRIPVYLSCLITLAESKQ